MATHADEATGIDRVAIVTGGSRGIGRQVTRLPAGQGYALVVYYARNQGAAETAVEEVLGANGAALAVRGDVADALDVERLFTETIEVFGGVDVVVHAVGQIILGPAVDDDLDGFDVVLRRNVRGTFLVNRQAARELRDGGAIINIFGPPSAGRSQPAPRTRRARERSRRSPECSHAGSVAATSPSTQSRQRSTGPTPWRPPPSLPSWSARQGARSTAR